MSKDTRISNAHLDTQSCSLHQCIFQFDIHTAYVSVFQIKIIYVSVETNISYLK
jgi:hypothetical protein